MGIYVPPFLDIIRAFPRNTLLAQQGSSRESLPNRPPIGRQVQVENAAARAALGHVVRVEQIKTPSGKLGVGVQFDCYERCRGRRPWKWR